MKTEGTHAMQPEYEYRPGPTKNHKRTQYGHLAEHLQKNPGVWVKVRTAPTQNAAAVASYQIRNGIRTAFRPAGHFDSYTEGREIIARYTGSGACHSETLAPGDYCSTCGTVNPEDK